MNRKTILVVGAALMALSLTAPAAASAGWTMGGNPSGGTIKFSGVVAFNTLGSGFECEEHMTFTANTGENTGQVHIRVTKTTCTGFGEFESCELEEVEETGEDGSGTYTYHVEDPWFGDPYTKITNYTPALRLSESCPAGEHDVLEFPEMIGTPDNPNAIGSMGFVGEGLVIVETALELPMEIVGELEAVESGTYGIA